MKILAIDTTESTASVAVTEGYKLLGLYQLNSGNTHSETILPMIDELLRKLKINVFNIDLIACAVGPGSFTGLRIGASTVKGLSYANKIACVGVSSLEAMAASMTSFKGLICPVINARRNQFYTSIYSSDGHGNMRCILDDRIMLLDELKEYFSRSNDCVYFVGSGYDVLTEAVSTSGYVPEPMRYENAYFVACTALKKYESASAEEKASFTADNLNPIYLRKAQAEQELEDRLAK